MKRLAIPLRLQATASCLRLTGGERGVTALLTALLLACVWPPVRGCVDASISPKWYAAGVAMLALLAVRIRVADKRRFVGSLTESVGRASLVALLFECAAVGVELCRHPRSVWTVGACGTFENPGSMAFTVCVLAVPAILFLKRQGLRRIGAVVACLVLAAVLLSRSRTGMLAIVLLAALYIVRNRMTAVWVRGATPVACAGLCLVCAVACKTDSTRGRWFIGQRTCELMLERPLLGHGRGGFVREYMARQGDYFSRHPESPAARLADEVRHPLSEFLLVGVDFGLVGLVVFVGFTLLPLFCLPSHSLSRWTLPVLLLFCCFSYPLVCPLGWLALLFAFFEMPAGWWRNGLVMAGAGAFLCVASEKVLQNTGVLRSPYYLYNKASREYRSGSLSVALEAARECATVCSGYNLELLTGDIERHLQHNPSAVRHYERALAMCPARFAPLEGLYWVCVADGDTVGKERVLRRIARKRVKVMSPEVRRIKALK